MSEETAGIAGLTEEGLQALLKNAIRNTLIVGMLVALALTIGRSWRDGAMFLAGALISAASILEWQRLVRLINSRIKKQKAERGTGVVIVFFLLRLAVFGAAIYGSLEFLRGSPIALVCGLGLAVATLTWEALRLLRG
ncbi:MAG TPA: hypothetical protein VLZ50_06500 [Terracidiphilus sp.]|nr:hypothetical protein [Terracidiphilus sp.]